MRRSKKVAAMLIAATMTIGLAGCGSKDNSAAPTPTGAAVTPETGNSEGEKISCTLTVWGPSEDQNADLGNWLPTQCEAFNAAHPEWDITFEYGVCSEADAGTMVSQDPAASADVYFYANDQLGTLIDANGIARLGGSAEEYIRSTNSEAIVNSVSVDGAVYGVPITTNTWFMYYDKSVFSEEDIKSLDAMLTKGKIAFPLNNSWYIASFYVANGCTLFGDGFDEAAGIDFSGDKAVAVTNYLVDLAANSNFMNDKDGTGISGLRDGSVKAMFSGSWDYSGVKEALGDNFGAASLPCITINGEEKQMKAFAGSKAIGVNPNAENPQIAVALATFLGGADAQKSHYELRSIVPCNTELLKEEAVQNDALVAAQNSTFDNTSIIQPFVSAMGSYWGPAENFGTSIMNGEVTHDNAAEKTEALNESLNSTGL